MSALPLGIIIISGGHDRAHAAMSLAAAAVALGRGVTVFATGRGIRALLEDWSTLDDSGHDAVLRGRGVPGFGVLRDSVRELGARLIACETALKGEALTARGLAAGVETAGLATFLEAVGTGQVVTV